MRVKMEAPAAWGVETQLRRKTLRFVKRSSLSLQRYASSECGSIQIRFASDTWAEMSLNELKGAWMSLNQSKWVQMSLKELKST